MIWLHWVRNVCTWIFLSTDADDLGLKTVFFKEVISSEDQKLIPGINFESRAEYNLPINCKWF